MRAADSRGQPSHPRLFLLVVAGVIGLLLPGAVALLAGDAGGPFPWWLRFEVVGFLLLVFGEAGYVALAVFERAPEA